MIYNITCNTDDNYIQHCMAMLCSLFENNKGKHFCVYILTSSLSSENIESLNLLFDKYKQEMFFPRINEALLDGVQFRKNRPLSKAAYYRLLLSSVLDVDKVLYLDCDMVILGDINELYNIDLTNYSLAACIDPMPFNNEHRMQLNLSVGTKTFCSGIMLLNLQYWRQNNSEFLLLSFAKKKREPVYLHDQDVLNYVFQNTWFVLPPKWNRTPMARGIYDVRYKYYDYYENYNKPMVYHYCSGVKPWENVFSLKRKYYVKYLYMSGYDKIKFNKVNIRKRLNVYYSCCIVYYLNNISPYMPKLIELLFIDIVRILRFIIVLLTYVFKPRNIKSTKLYFYK